MKIIIAPDSFKGSMSAVEFCETASEVIKSNFPEAEVLSFPLADGGEGTADCIAAVKESHSNYVFCTTPFLGKTRYSTVLRFDDNQVAVVESAKTMGLPLAAENLNPEITTTYGVGQMILFAIEKGVKKIILTLGGSSTNDCGAGMLCALGAKFYNKSGSVFIPTGGTLIDIEKADFTVLEKIISGIEFTAMCDVTNPLCGENGCSAVFGPQKGATPEMVERLDKGCAHFAEICGKEFAEVPGAGAAGGLGYATIALLHGKLESGIKMIFDLYNFEKNLIGCDYILTGEGRFDNQSLMGKTICGLIEIAKEKCPLVVFCGQNKLEKSKQPEGIRKIIEISENQELDYALAHGKENLKKAVLSWCEELKGIQKE